MEIYNSGQYLENTGGTWHSEDSLWKAQQISRIIDNNHLHPKKIAEIGCGAGQILVSLSKTNEFKNCHFEGYDISQDAIDLCASNASNCSFYCQDLLEVADDNNEKIDILLVIDVVEHVTDYMGFIEKCNKKATYKIYHIPLDVHVSSVLRNTFIHTRNSVGHLHYFTADSALATLRDTGQEVVDFFYTDGSFGLFRKHPSLKKAVANIPRYVLSRFSVPFAARALGGYSLLVLVK